MVAEVAFFVIAAAVFIFCAGFQVLLAKRIADGEQRQDAQRAAGQSQDGRKGRAELEPGCLVGTCRVSGCAWRVA